jgi:predicted DNA-binding transcriptional regulator AlpA
MARRPNNPEPAPRLERILRRHQLPAYVGLRATQIDILRKLGKFPRGFNISERAVGWFESDIIAWQQARARAGKSTVAV